MYTLLFIFSLAALGLTIWAQVKVKGSFRKWSVQPVKTGITGAEVARQILDNHGLRDVPVEMVRGELTDHYDPIARKVRLSQSVYGHHSISAVAVAAHECGHALQHQESYGMLTLRHRLFPLVHFTSGVAPLLLLAGILFQMLGLILVGVIFFTVTVAFQLITLPVEFNASSRAKQILIQDRYIQNEEKQGISKVLNAAALTYVAAALYAIVELARFIFLFFASAGREE